MRSAVSASPYAGCELMSGAERMLMSSAQRRALRPYCGPPRDNHSPLHPLAHEAQAAFLKTNAHKSTHTHVHVGVAAVQRKGAEGERRPSVECGRPVTSTPGLARGAVSSGCAALRVCRGNTTPTTGAIQQRSVCECGNRQSAEWKPPLVGC